MYVCALVALFFFFFTKKRTVIALPRPPGSAVWAEAVPDAPARRVLVWRATLAHDRVVQVDGRNFVLGHDDGGLREVSQQQSVYHSEWRRITVSVYHSEWRRITVSVITVNGAESQWRYSVRVGSG